MRHFIILLIATLLMLACQEQNKIVNPENNSLSKKPTVARVDEYDYSRLDEGIGYNVVDYGNVKYSEFLDEVSSGRGKNKTTTTVYNPDKVVEIYLEQGWYADEWTWRVIRVTLKVEGKDIDWNNGSDLITGTGDNRELNFNAIFSKEDCSADFQPTPFTFASPITMDIEWEEVPQALYDELQQGNLFGYIAPDGTAGDTTPYSSISFSDVKNTISLTGAQIAHFSRYGFLR
jgi:hypothetical protein